MQSMLETKGGPRIAVCIDKSRVYGVGILQGLADYLELHGPWSVFVEPFSTGSLPWRRLDTWKGSGILALLCNEESARRVGKLTIPTVDVCGNLGQQELEKLGIPCVCSNHCEIGGLAAEHLLECGYPHFAFSGYRSLKWVEVRWHGFHSKLADCDFESSRSNQQSELRKGLAEKHFKVDCRRHEYALPPSQIGDPSRSLQRWAGAQKKLITWLQKLPKPVGIMACNDSHALDLLDACQEAGLVVPDDVGIVGVDNDEALCRLSKPPLSSVIPDPRQIGFQAARALDDLMSGRTIDESPQHYLVSPIDVAARRSTQGTAVQDETIASALRIIRDNAASGISAEQVLRQTKLSRRAFYRRFQDQVGRTPHEEISRVRHAHVKRLLRETNLSLEKVAELTGYCSSAHMSVNFKKKLGIPPGEFRRRQHYLS